MKEKSKVPPNWKMSDVDNFRHIVQRLDEILKQQIKRREKKNKS